jgi:hypothetical protein
VEAYQIDMKKSLTLRLLNSKRASFFESSRSEIFKAMCRKWGLVRTICCYNGFVVPILSKIYPVRNAIEHSMKES